MKTSPLFMAFLYLAIGFVFTYLAVHYANEYGMTSIWTIITMVVATFDFANSIRYFALNNHLKRKQKK
ncbi:YdiK family protein [Fictibacillus nanhaiensis]|uniref:YdiK family protein n=1 Tax=Fictibacillus nanhaiensis TaxID=742169 RepID=UPI001C9785C5|nr:YdiK family protein [Fictibacillus nanhaiensis]MBY6038581.1 YdiK family protein [Fictibacillus nanhaiensis]